MYENTRRDAAAERVLHGRTTVLYAEPGRLSPRSDDGGNNWLAVRRHGMFYFFLLESPL